MCISLSHLKTYDSQIARTVDSHDVYLIWLFDFNSEVFNNSMQKWLKQYICGKTDLNDIWYC